MKNHTPGPWKLTGWTAPDSYGWNIECDQRFQLHAESAESEANAYLIAAAPELLEALEDAATQLQCGCGHPSCGRCKDSRYYTEVIAKAKGEKP